MKLSLIDNLAWFAARLLGLIMANILELVLKFYKPRDTQEYSDLVGYWMSSWYIFSAKSPNDLPEFMSQKIMFQGKLILLLLGFLFFTSIMSVVVK